MEHSLKANSCCGSCCTQYKSLCENEFYLAICHVSSVPRFSYNDQYEKEDAQGPNHSQWKDQCEEI